MRKYIILIAGLIILSSVLSSYSTFAQVFKQYKLVDAFPDEINKKEFQYLKTVFYDGVEHLYAEEYEDARKKFHELLYESPDNSHFNYLMGVCVLNTEINKSLAVPYLKKAVKKIGSNHKEESFEESSAPPLAHYYLGLTYHHSMKFDSALFQYNSFQSTIKPSDDILSDVKSRINSCYSGKDIVRSPKSVIVEKFPRLSKNDKIRYLSIPGHNEQNSSYFTNPHEHDKNSLDIETFFYSINFNEIQPSKTSLSDLYISWDEDNKWTEPVPMYNIDNSIFFCGMSHDWDMLFYTSLEDGRYNMYYHDITMYHTWSKPRKFPSEINSKYNETFATISSDGQTVYFVSDRPGGFGGKDIYKSVKDGSHWGPAINLGSVINSQYDEESPYISKNGRYMYFSSKGHDNIGGYDIFRSKKSNGNWTKVENLGLPVNSTYDELYFMISNEIQSAFYTSNKEGKMKESNIYILSLD